MVIEKPTVLILGAGASAHLGYPIGIGLLNQICSRIRENQIDDEIKRSHPASEIESFRVRLSRSGYSSVDAFLEKNMEFMAMGKLFIASCLKQHENPDIPFHPGDAGWYQYLFNRLIGNEVEDISRNKLSIITFNYDRSLEFYLHQVIQYRFKIPDDKALDILHTIPIVHVHGILGEYPQVEYSLARVPLAEISDKIKIVHEINDNTGGFCNDDFKRANDLLQKSERIFSLGFGFYKSNIRRLGFFTKEALAKREVTAAVANLSPREMTGLIEHIAEYGFTSGHFTTWDCLAFFRYAADL
jgi:hypothetical protein